MKKGIILLTCLFIMNYCLCQIEQKIINYQDTGFCFVIGPHNLCIFIPSKQKNLEMSLLTANKNQPLQYINIYSEEFNQYFDVDLSLTDTLKRHKSSITYSFGNTKLDSIEYYRVYTKIKIPMEEFCYNKKRQYNSNALKFNKRVVRLYSLIAKHYLSFECIEFKILPY